MTVVNPTQSSAGDTIEAADINTPVNQLAAVLNGAIDATNLADSAVTTAKIAARAVTEAKLTHSPSEYVFDHVASGLVITADSAGVNKNYSITSGVVYLAGIRHTVASVSAQTVAASKDRYIDVRSNGDGTASYVTNEVNNNATSQALTAGDLRVGIVVAGATFITNSASINQGQEDRILPIASSIPYAVTDSLGNLICPRDPNRRVLGYRQVIANSSGTTIQQVVGLTCPVIVPTTRKIRISVHIGTITNTTSGQVASTTIWDGVVNAGTQLGQDNASEGTGVQNQGSNAFAVTTPSSASKTYNAGVAVTGGTFTVNASATNPAYIMVELA